MKRHLLTTIGLMAILLATACHRKAAPQPPAAPEIPTTPIRPANEPKPEVYQVAGYQKTACFGKCPVYQVKFFTDGRATWYGQHNVERMGWYEARVDKAVLDRIREKALSVNFWDFAGAYPTGQRVADLPSTVTYLRAGDVEKSVVNTHQGPLELEIFEAYLEGVITGLEWRPTASK